MTSIIKALEAGKRDVIFRKLTLLDDLGVDAFEIDFSHVIRFADMESVLLLEWPIDTSKIMPWETLKQSIKASNILASITIVAIPYNTPNQLVAELAKMIGVCIVFPEERLRICGSESPETEIRQLLYKKLGRQTLSIFQSEGAVTGSRFFGRKHLVEQIIRHPERSFLVSGIRMSGKSSLLLETKRRIDERSAEIETRPSCIYIDCRSHHTFPEMIAGILVALQETEARTHAEYWINPLRWQHFFRVLRNIANGLAGKKLRLFFDEYDRVSKYPTPDDLKIDWQFRNLHTSNAKETSKIQFVIAGSAKIASVCRDVNSGLYNFLNTSDCRLKNFDLGTIRDMVVPHFEALGYEIAGDSQRLANVIAGYTGGRPSSIQFLCSQLVTKLDNNGTSEARLDEDKISGIVKSAEYREHHRLLIDQNATELQRYILRWHATTSRGAKKFFKLGDLKTHMNMKSVMQASIPEINEALDDMVQSGLLEIDDSNAFENSYDFALPVIRELFTPR